MFSFDNTELLVACQKNYNDWRHDYATASNGRLFGLAAIPVQDPTATVKELRRVIKIGYKGGLIPCTAPYETPYHDPVYEPIWALAEEAGFPLSMHAGTNAYVPPQYRNKNEPRDSIFDYANAPASVQRTLVQLICRGVASKHPNLKFVVSEFNGGLTGSIRAWRVKLASRARNPQANRPRRFGSVSSTPPSKMTARLFLPEN